MVPFKQSEDPFKKQKCRRIERRAVQKKGILRKETRRERKRAETEDA